MEVTETTLGEIRKVIDEGSEDQCLIRFARESTGYKDSTLVRITITDEAVSFTIEDDDA